MSGILVGGLIWGVLVLFFLTPFREEQADSLSWKASLWKIVTQRKVILVPTMLAVTLFGIWLYHADIVFYHEIHGEPLTFDPMIRAWLYMFGLMAYTVLLAFLVVYREIRRFA